MIPGPWVNAEGNWRDFRHFSHSSKDYKPKLAFFCPHCVGQKDRYEWEEKRVGSTKNAESIR